MYLVQLEKSYYCPTSNKSSYLILCKEADFATTPGHDMVYLSKKGQSNRIVIPKKWVIAITQLDIIPPSNNLCNYINFL